MYQFLQWIFLWTCLSFVCSGFTQPGDNSECMQGERFYYPDSPGSKDYRMEVLDMGKVTEYRDYKMDSTGKRIESHKIISIKGELIGRGEYRYDNQGKILSEYTIQWKKWGLIIDTLKGEMRARWDYLEEKREETISYIYGTEPGGHFKKTICIYNGDTLYYDISHYNLLDSLVLWQMNGNLQTVYLYNSQNKLISENSFYDGDSLCRLKIHEYDPGGLRKVSYGYEDVPVYDEIRTKTLPGSAAPVEKEFYYYDSNRRLIRKECLRLGWKNEYNNSYTERYSYDSLGRVLTFCFENQAPLHMLKVKE